MIKAAICDDERAMAVQLSWLLMIVLIAPNTSALSLNELGLATGSEAEQDAEKNPDKGGTAVSDESKELHKEGPMRPGTGNI